MKTMLMNEFDDNTGKYAIVEVEVPLEWLGKSVGKLDVRKKYNVNVIALKQGNRVSSLVDSDTVLTSEKTMLVLGESTALQNCFHI